MKKENFQGFYSRLLRLALPIALQNLLSSSAQLIDTAMVVGLGNVATAAAGVAIRWNFLLNLTVFGLCSGTAAMCSQFWGAKNYQAIRKTFGIALICAVCLGFIYNAAAFLFPEALLRVFTSEIEVISYGITYLKTVSFFAIFMTFSMLISTILRSIEDVLTPLFAAILSIVLNTFLNYLLIYGKLGLPALGLKGAGVATVISAAVQAILLLLLSIRKKAIFISSINDIFSFNKTFVKKFIRTVTPVLSNEMLWAFGTNIYVMVLARQGSENYAAYTMFSAIEQLFFVFFIGICHACAIIVGKTVGEGKIGEAYALGKRFLVITPLGALVIGVIMILSRNIILSFMPIETEAAREITSKLLLLYGFWLSVRMIPYTSIVGVFRAGGDTKTGLIIDSVNLYLLGVPLVILFGFFTGIGFVPLIFIMYAGEDTIKLVMCLIHFKSKKWIKPLTG